MPTRKKSTRRRAAVPKFLVVRGSGNTVMISKLQFSTKNASLAKAIDRHRAGKGVARAKKAFVVTGVGPLLAYGAGVRLHALGVRLMRRGGKRSE